MAEFEHAISQGWYTSDDMATVMYIGAGGVEYTTYFDENLMKMFIA